MQNEKEILLRRYKLSKDYRERERLLGVLLVKFGKSILEVSRLLFVDQQSIRNWVKEWDESQELKDKPRSGQPRKISKEIEEEISRLVDKNNPSDEGLHVATWDCRELRIWLKAKYNIYVTDECLRKLLIKNKFHYRKVNYKFTKADPEEQAEFVQNLQDIHKQLEGTFVFQDEMASKLHPNKGYIWTREKKPFVETVCSHKKQYIIGGVAPDNGKVISLVEEKFNAKSFILWLRLVLESITGNIYLVMDNHPSHHSKAVKQFLENHPRIVPIFIAKYSPEMNPQENFWNYLRKKFLNHKLFETIEGMKKGIEEFIRTIPQEVIKGVCSYQYLLTANTKN